MRVDLNKVGLLKEPFGHLIKDSDASKSYLEQILKNAQKIITVGDTTTEKLVHFGVIPDISIVDGKEQRVKKDKIIEYPVDKKLYFENKPGEINEQIIHVIEKLALDNFEKKIQFIIDGEEDLLALPIFIFAPDGWTVFYGQPNEGLVVVYMNGDLRRRAKLIFDKVFISG